MLYILFHYLDYFDFDFVLCSFNRRQMQILKVLTFAAIDSRDFANILFVREVLPTKIVKNIEKRKIGQNALCYGKSILAKVRNLFQINT